MTKKTNNNSAAAAVVGNDISWIKKEVGEIKVSLQSMVSLQETKINSLEDKIDTLSKTVFIGIGIATTIAFALPLLIKFLTK